MVQHYPKYKPKRAKFIKEDVYHKKESLIELEGARPDPLRIIKEKPKTIRDPPHYIHVHPYFFRGF
jgi:hypothetical protein